MKFAAIPKAQYKIGQEVEVLGYRCRVESYSHTGTNVVVHTIDAPRFQRIVCLVSDAVPIEEITK